MAMKAIDMQMTNRIMLTNNPNKELFVSKLTPNGMIARNDPRKITPIGIFVRL